MPASGSCVSRILSASRFVDIENEHGDDGVRRGLGAEVAVDEHQRAVGQLAGQQRVGVSDLGQHAAECVLLLRRVEPPIAWVRSKVAGADAAKFFDSVADLHRSSVVRG